MFLCLWHSEAQGSQIQPLQASKNSPGATEAQPQLCLDFGWSGCVTHGFHYLPGFQESNSQDAEAQLYLENSVFVMFRISAFGAEISLVLCISCL